MSASLSPASQAAGAPSVPDYRLLFLRRFLFFTMALVAVVALRSASSPPAFVATVVACSMTLNFAVGATGQ